MFMMKVPANSCQMRHKDMQTGINMFVNRFIAPMCLQIWLMLRVGIKFGLLSIKLKINGKIPKIP